jgi:hypothetical protein
MFILMVGLVIYSPEIPVGVLKISVAGEWEVTSLAIASIIMILYNFFTWIEFTQNLRESTRFSEKDKEIDRAKLLIDELDEVCDYCTTIK